MRPAPRFLRWYALYLAAEKRVAEEAAESADTAPPPPAVAAGTRAHAPSSRMVALATEVSAAHAASPASFDASARLSTRSAPASTEARLSCSCGYCQG